MLHAHKAALANTLRTRMVALRQQELQYYTNNCRLLGDQGALIAGFAFSGIRYHQFAEQQEGWYLTSTETLEESIFLFLLTVAMGAGLQTVLLSTLVALFGPHMALRGPDGSLHAAVNGMQHWTRIVLAWFLLSLLTLQLSALSFVYGHNRLGDVDRLLLVAVTMTGVSLNVYYGWRTVRKFALHPERAVTGAFWREGRDHGHYRSPQSSLFKDGGLSLRRGRCRATRLFEDEGMPLTAEGLDVAIEQQERDAAEMSAGAARDDEGIPSHLFASPPLCDRKGLHRLLWNPRSERTRVV
tara:strand:+ start:273 stop:1166 length:894 start_codon:yes stop_codon:yes gene_type:complete